MMSQDAQVCRRSWNRKYRIMMSTNGGNVAISVPVDMFPSRAL